MVRPNEFRIHIPITLSKPTRGNSAGDANGPWMNTNWRRRKRPLPDCRHVSLQIHCKIYLCIYSGPIPAVIASWTWLDLSHFTSHAVTCSWGLFMYSTIIYWKGKYLNICPLLNIGKYRQSVYENLKVLDYLVIS